MGADAAAAAAGLVALGAAWRFRWLAPRALGAAAAVGAAVLAGAGGGGLALLLAFFVSASLLTRLGGSTKPAGGPEHGRRRRRGRRTGQVLANGGVAAAAGLAGLAGWVPGAHYALAGALAAATADTWATEVGTWAAAGTRLVTTWERVPPGRSGGVSLPGTAAGLAGALGLGLLAGLLLAGHGADGAAAGAGTLAWAVASLVGGTAGMLTDSVLGATLEDRVLWVDNDGVNLAGTLAGALAALAAAAGWPA